MGVRPLQFTEKQTQILQMLAAGGEYKEIATTLGTTTQSVKNRIYEMLQESGSDNSRHLIAQAFRAGLLR